MVNFVHDVLWLMEIEGEVTKKIVKTAFLGGLKIDYRSKKASCFCLYGQRQRIYYLFYLVRERNLQSNKHSFRLTVLPAKSLISGMVTIETFRQMALSLPDTVELPHFEKTSFRISNKIFATLAEEKSIAMVTLSQIDQSVFCAFDKSIIYPVPGAWGAKGYTYIDLKKIKKLMLKDALECAYQNTIAGKK